MKEKGDAKRSLIIIIRLYDQGVALRYRIPGKGTMTFTDDQTHFTFATDPTCWGANGERANIGPVKLSKFRGRYLPVTLKVADDCHCSILEAGIYQFSKLTAKKAGPKTLRTSFSKSVITLPAETSWRTLLLGKTPGDLLTGNVMVNLNPPCAIKDTSWIKPGISFWDWRSWGATGKDGFRYNLDMASWRRFIDFASKNGVDYLLLDANWYGMEFNPKSNPMKSRDYLIYQVSPTSAKMGKRPAPKDWKDPIDIPKLIKYAKKRNVSIILYINDVARNNWDFEKTLKTYHEWGAAGIKYGFMKSKGQKKVLDTRKIVKLCAKYQLLCDFHDGPIPPSGDRRTYPNYVAREYCHAQADAKKSFSPRTFCTTVFCNMLAGPLDMNNGFFTLTGIEKVRPKVFKTINSTVTGEAARVLVTFSGMAIIPDTPDSYGGKADLFTFIKDLPMTWDETRILNSSIGEFITTARRAGEQWFIGSCCNEKGADLTINLSFLKEGQAYKATLYEDASDAHYRRNKDVYKISTKTVKKGEILNIRLAPGGGHCIKLKPIN